MYDYYNTDFTNCQASAEENMYFKHKILSLQRTKALSAALLAAAEENVSPVQAQKLKQKAYDVLHCADYFNFHIAENGKIIKILTNRCKNRYCTYCQWVEARKRGRILSGALELARSRGEKIVHLVITLPNCSAQNLHTEVNNLHNIISQTLRHFKIKNFYRATEVTYNEKNGTFHPHAHIAVFKYVKVSELSAFTAKCYRKINSSHKYDFNICYATAKSIEKELAKYIMKPDKLPHSVLKSMIQNDALTGVRMRSAGGTVKDYMQQAAEILNVTAAAEKQNAFELGNIKKVEYMLDFKTNLYGKLR